QWQHDAWIQFAGYYRVLGLTPVKIRCHVGTFRRQWQQDACTQSGGYCRVLGMSPETMATGRVHPVWWILQSARDVAGKVPLSCRNSQETMATGR
ncbi:hypothetical protein J6590_107225, partial [Homalodisca vitripennis]